MCVTLHGHFTHLPFLQRSSIVIYEAVVIYLLKLILLTDYQYIHHLQVTVFYGRVPQNIVLELYDIMTQ